MIGACAADAYDRLRDRFCSRPGDFSPTLRDQLLRLLDELEAAGVRPFDQIREKPLPGTDRRITLVWTQGQRWLAVSWTMSRFDRRSWRYRMDRQEGKIDAAEIAELVSELDAMWSA